jgi:hypothetical protein
MSNFSVGKEASINSPIFGIYFATYLREEKVEEERNGRERGGAAYARRNQADNLMVLVQHLVIPVNQGDKNEWSIPNCKMI